MRAPLSEAPDDLVELGRVVSAYGVRGWVKIQPYASDAHVLLQASRWWLEPPASPLGAAGVFRAGESVAAGVRDVSVLAARPQGATVVAQLEGIQGRDDAEALKGWRICVSRAAFPAPQDDEYYWVDLIGCRLYGEDAGQPALLGVVAEVSDNGAHAVLHVNRATEDAGGELQLLHDAKGRPQTLLVPFVQAHVHTVDLSARRLDSDWPVDF